MEARIWRAAALAAIVLSYCTAPVWAGTPQANPTGSYGGNFRTQHFVVTAATPEIAKAIAEQAEVYRRDLAILWLGRELPEWSAPCPITVQTGENLGAGGATSFMFERGQPFGWRMSIQGSYQRVMDSVLPHEITHTIFATHFGQPLPRWADEGACTTVEDASEKTKQHHNLIRFLQTNRGIAFNKMFRMREYPPDVLPLYAQGYSVTRYLIAQGGERHFVNYVGEGLRTENWPEATKKFYGYEDLSDLQVKWVAWVAAGSPPLEQRTPSTEAVAVVEQAPPSAYGDSSGPVARGQSPQREGLFNRWRSRGQRRRGGGEQLVEVPPQPQVTEQSSARQLPPQQPDQRVLEPVHGAAAGRSYYDRGSPSGTLPR